SPCASVAGAAAEGRVSEECEREKRYRRRGQEEPARHITVSGRFQDDPGAHERVLVRELGHGLYHREGFRSELERLGRRAVGEYAERRVLVDQALEEALGLVRDLAHAVAVLVVADVIAPEIAASVPRPHVTRKDPSSPYLDLLVVPRKAVGHESVSPYRRHDRDADVVVGDDVAVDLVPGFYK